MDGNASFELVKTMYDSHCVLDAIWLASNGAGGGGGAIEGATVGIQSNGGRSIARSSKPETLWAINNLSFLGVVFGDSLVI
jgi:hypothetical protein